MVNRNKRVNIFDEDELYSSPVKMDMIVRPEIDVKSFLNKTIGKDIKANAKNDSQRELITSIKNNEITICKGKPGSGKTYLAVTYALSLLNKKETPYEKIYLVKSVQPLKNEDLGFLKGPQPYYEKVLTVDGWKTMGEITTDDYVYGSNGKPIKVLETFEKDEKDIYRISLKDKRFVDCCIDHYWNVKIGNLGYTNVNTKFILDNFNKTNFYLPQVNPIEFNNNINLKLNPYLLGVFIGDGCLTGSHIRFCNIDEDIINKCINIAHSYNLTVSKSNITYNLVAPKTNTRRGAKLIRLTNVETNEIFEGFLADIKEKTSLGDGTIIKRCNENTIHDGIKFEYLDIKSKSNNIVREYLIELGLLGKAAFDKFIPSEYKTTTIENRVELLRGLLDIDGTIKKNGEIVYMTTSKQLSEDVKELVLSLGGSARIYEIKQKDNNQVLKGHRVIGRRNSFNVYIKFKNNYFNPFFCKRKADRFCVKSYESQKIVNVEKLNETSKMKCILVDSDDHLYVTKDYILTHNTMTEKIQPYMWSYFINIQKVIGQRNLDTLLENKIIEPFPLAYMRGASLDNCIIIADEAQNITINNIKTLMTRIGENVKLIILGDTNQIDLVKPMDSSLKYIIDMFKDIANIGVIEMNPNDTSIRNPLIDIIEERFNNFELKQDNHKKNKKEQLND